MSHEFDFYLEILGEFAQLDDNPNLKEAWKVNSIIKLMALSKQLNDNGLIETGLVIIINLATGKYLDDVEKDGRDLKDLLKHEREIVIASLKSELN